ncbi:MAG: RDD family protein [Pirellula sp.]|jgi:uncharacterized RDD family membrane protein YckC|nr:RDD family protein [Pirellula sp.]
MSHIENPYAPTMSPAIREDASLDGELATRSERFAGAFIDGIINLIASLPLAFGVGMIVGATMGDTVVSQLVAQVLGGMIGIGIFVAIQGYFLATRSQTIGKMAVKTKIVSDSGQPLTFAELYFKRYLILQVASLVPFIGGFVGLADALAIFRANRKCLHDDIAGTKVIKIDPSLR